MSKQNGRAAAPAARGTDFRQIVLREKSPFAYKEAYKALRTKVSFSLPGTGCKVIGLTSANRAEGKSSTAVNLAISFAQIEKKVLLIDCDLRLPTVAGKLGLNNVPGLSDFLVGESDISKILRRAENGYFDVLPAGNIPPDATGLLESDLMGDLLTKLRERYQYILIDLPPILSVTDAAILSRYIDGFLLVVRHDSTEYRAINEMLRQMRMAHAKILGFVYNDAPSMAKKYYSYYRKNQ